MLCRLIGDVMDNGDVLSRAPTQSLGPDTLYSQSSSNVVSLSE